VGIPASEQVDDSERLVLEHFDVIRDSPTHIYHSALPLCPSSWLRGCYKTEAAREVNVLMGLPDKWDTCSRTISVEGEPSVFAHWGDVIAVGLDSNVVLLDAITGRRTSVLSSHTYGVLSLAFSLDGTLLVSGSVDQTVKLWDIQTGGVIKTFTGPTFLPSTVSISSDCTTIASGTHDGTIRLWDIRTGKCRPAAFRHDNMVTAVIFSPINSRRLISSSFDGTVRQWDVDGHQIGTPYREAARVDNVAYASDGNRFVSCGGATAVVRETESGMVVAKLDAPKKKAILKYGCFSPDGRFVACATGNAIYVWDITNSEVRLVGNLVGHTRFIHFIAFSTSLISGSDLSVKFWQSSSFLTDSMTTDSTPPPLSSSPIVSANLFAEDGTVVTSDSSGVVKTWDLTTGRCKSSFSTPSQGIQDTHLAGDTLIVVWCAVGDKEYHVLDVGKDERQTVCSSLDEILDLRISGDGSKIFGAGSTHIEARSIPSGEDAGLIEHGNRGLSLHALFRDKKEGLSSDFLVVRGSKVWLAESNDVGWDFEGREVSPFTLSNELLDRPRFRLVDGPPKQYTVKPAWIQDTVTGRPIFHLAARYLARGMKRRWNGRYLLVWSPSGEMVVMDFDCVFPR
jgi:WD40 repeat protein